MSGPNFNDVSGFFDCSDAVYRAHDGALLCLRRCYAGWRIEECSFVDDDEDGSGRWVTDAETFHATLRDVVRHVRTLNATRLRDVFDY
jgi:hypothetical protein